MSFRFAAAGQLAALLLPFVLAACADSATVCRTELPLEERDHLMLAHVTVNGTAVPGILDTGAQISAVTEGLVTRLGLLGDLRNSSLMAGVGGEGTVQNDALVGHFALAGFDPGTGHYPVITLPLDETAATPGAPPVGALIGADVLSHFDIDLDVAGHRAVLYDPARCQGTLPDWQGPATQIPLEVIWTGRLLLKVRLDGQEVEALLDSGATGTVLDLPAAERLGVSREALAREPGGDGFGAAGVNFRRVLHTFHMLEIGGEQYEAPKLSVLDRPLHDADMLLGLDWLSHHRVWISYRRRMMFVALPIG